MKVAVLFAHAWIPSSVDMTQYLRTLRDMGHESLIVCLDRSEGPDGYNAVPADLETLQNPAFYENLGIDAAIAFTWFIYPHIITAMKSAGVKVLIRGDCDGQLSIRQFPAHHYRVRLSAANGLMQSAIATKHFLHRYLFEYIGEDRDRLASIAAADISVLETAEAARHIQRFLRWQGRSDLIPRVQVVPHLVANEFLTGEVNPVRSDSVVAIGRWEDPQKNAPLLCATIALHLAKYPETNFFILGGENGRSAFDRLIAKYSQVTYTGPQRSAAVRRYLADARILLSSSRWEGSPVVANESLAMGTTIVGTPIPAFMDLGRNGFGTIASQHSASTLAAALAEETENWRAGKRDPVAIAQHWRPLLSAKVVVSSLCRMLLGESDAKLLEIREPQAV